MRERAKADRQQHPDIPDLGVAEKPGGGQNDNCHDEENNEGD
jgi:hypothetical protein